MSTDPLIEAAIQVREKAYCPYSGYRVGAALETADGTIFVGCNVENVSFGATICAERMAVGAMVAAGYQSFSRLAVVTKDGGTPCGVCLQVLSEFADDATVVAVSAEGTVEQCALHELIPRAFKTQDVSRTAR